MCVRMDGPENARTQGSFAKGPRFVYKKKKTF